MSRRRASVAASAVTLAALLTIVGCAPPSSPTPSPTAAPTTAAPTPEPYAGPLLFVGDELDAFALTADEVAATFPGASDVGDLLPELEQISDGGGPDPIPVICWAPMVEQSLWSVAARTSTWSTPVPPLRGAQQVLQFGAEEQAAGRMDQLLSAAAQCGQFEFDGPATFTTATADEVDGVRALAGVIDGGDEQYDVRMLVAFAQVGNVLVTAFQPFEGEPTFDPAAAAALLRDRAVEARTALIEKLTDEPPATPEPEQTADPAAPWSEWRITTGGIGPVRIGDDMKQALAAVAAADIVEPEFEGGTWKAVADDGVSTLFVQPSPDGATVAAVIAGAEYSHDGTAHDGAALPAAGEVRVGSLVDEARAAYPGGTTTHVVASGEDFYDIATRDGRLLRFRADRDAADPAAAIIGITVEDATLRRPLAFG